MARKKRHDIEPRAVIQALRRGGDEQLPPFHAGTVPEENPVNPTPPRPVAGVAVRVAFATHEGSRVLLRLEAYALLAGTLLLLLGIAALMWSTERLAEPPSPARG